MKALVERLCEREEGVTLIFRRGEELQRFLLINIYWFLLSGKLATTN